MRARDTLNILADSQDDCYQTTRPDFFFTNCQFVPSPRGAARKFYESGIFVRDATATKCRRFVADMNESQEEIKLRGAAATAGFPAINTGTENKSANEPRGLHTAELPIS